MTALIPGTGDSKRCEIENCHRSAPNRRYCGGHYYRLRRYGDPLGGGRIRYETPEETFLAYQAREGECLVWTAGTTNGYGVMNFGQLMYVHRYAWERAHGNIPDGMLIDHACHNRLCVNVDHLRLATKATNAQNQNGPNSRNTHGIRNAFRDGNQWEVRLQKNKRRISVGRFDSEEEAQEAAAKARKEHFGEFAGRG